MKILISLFVLIIGFQSFAGLDLCEKNQLENQPILADGRMKPLIVHAAELRKKIFSSSCNISPVELYCRLSHGQRKDIGQGKGCQLTFKVDHEKAMKILGVSTHEVSPDVVEKNSFALSEEYKNEELQGRKEGGYALTLARLLTSQSTLKEIESGHNWKILIEKNKWVSFSEISSENQDLILQQSQHLSLDDQNRIEREILFYKINPFSHAIWIGILAFLISLGAVRIQSLYRFAMGASLGLLVLQVFGITLRSLVSGRAPVTNMYETVMWVGIGVLSLSLFMAAVKKDAKLLSVGLGGNVIALFMMKFATTMLDESIRPLVPVLRDNFWLSTHVTTITLSYACFALSWVLANVGLIGVIVGRLSKSGLDYINEALRLGIQVGSVMLAAGIILGGVWADYSWGRFWGWDPKETWSLIALMIYMMILHGRYAGWFKGLVLTQMGAGGFLFVLMAWFGVNYILASGLHSYGFSSGGAAFLLTVFLVQIFIIFVSVLRRQRVS